MKIKEVSEHTGLSQKAIRLYEEKELVVPAMKENSGRYFREYSEADLKKLSEIALLRQSGFSIAQIKELYSGSVKFVLKEYQTYLIQQIKEQTQVLNRISKLETNELEELLSVLQQPEVKHVLQDEFQCAELEERKSDISKNIWYWCGIIPHRLSGFQYFLCILLYQTPMTAQAVLTYCIHGRMKMSFPKLNRTLQRLQKAGFLECSNGVYTCRHSDFMLYENVFSENDLMEMLQMMQGGGAHRFFFHSSAPMSVGSWSPGPK